MKRVEHIVRAIREEEAKILPEWKVEHHEQDDETLQRNLALQKNKARSAYRKDFRIHKLLVRNNKIIHDWVQKRLAERAQLQDQLLKEKLTKIKIALKEEKKQRAIQREKDYIKVTSERIILDV